MAGELGLDVPDLHSLQRALCTIVSFDHSCISAQYEMKHETKMMDDMTAEQKFITAWIYS